MPIAARSKTARSCVSWNCWLASEPSASNSNASWAGSSDGSSSPASWALLISRSMNAVELAHVLGDDVAHGVVGAAVELGLDVAEEAAAGEDLGAEVLQPVLEQRLEAGAAAGEVARGADDVVDEAPAGGVDRRQLQLLLGAEVGEQAALAHVQLGREAADRQALQALDGGEVGGRLEDRLAGRVAAAPAAVGLVDEVRVRRGRAIRAIRRPSGEESSTTVRSVVQSTTDRAFFEP